MANRKHLAILKQGVEVWNKWREEHRDVMPDFRGANLGRTNLSLVDLKGVDLAGSDLREANLTGVDLREADLRSALLTRTNLDLANLFEADLNHAILWNTVFADVDLSRVKGLETVIHLGPSTIGIDTIYRSGGKIPEVFLRGAGVPDEFITFMHDLVASQGRVIQFYSCFISYSSQNQDFAERLHADLQAKNVRCWFAPEDLKIGAKTRDTIHEAIRLHDKLLVILSDQSVASDWVEDEVEKALEQERKDKRLVLFPVRIDDAVMETNKGWAENIRNTRNIGNFTRWKDHDSYQKALSRLLRDLKAGET